MEFKNISQVDCEFNGVMIHNPTIKELSRIFNNEEDFFFILKLFYNELKYVIDTNIDKVSNFEIFYTLLLTPQEIKNFDVERRKSIFNFLKLIFKDFQIKAAEKSFIFEQGDIIFILKEDNFDDFCLLIKNMFGVEDFFKNSEDGANYNPSDARAKAIADKIMQGRKKVAQEKNQDIQIKKGVIENYVNILSIGLKIPSSTLCETLTFYSLIQTYKRYRAKQEWDLDIKQRLAGGTPEESPDFWMNFY